LLTPFAALGAFLGDPVGMAAARLAMVGVGAVNVVVVYRLARVVIGDRPAALAAPLLYAVAPAAVGAEHVVLLEPLTNVFVLTALLLVLGGRHDVVAGVLLGAGLAVKAFAVVYLVAVFGWIAWRSRERLIAVSLGAAGSLLGLFVPFAVLAGPSRLWRDLVTSQLDRPADGGSSPLAVVASLLGFGAHPGTGLRIVALAAIATLVGACVHRVRSGRQSTSSLPAAPPPGAPALSQAPSVPLLFTLIAAGVGTAFVVSPSYFGHYADFFVPPFALTLAVLVASGGWPMRLPCVLLAVGGLAGSVDGIATGPRPASLAAVARYVPGGACVYSDAVSLLVAANRLRLPDPSCPGWLDGRGQNLVWSVDRRQPAHFYPAGFLSDRAWQRQTGRQLAAASFLLVRADPTSMQEWSAPLRSYVASHFRLVWSSGPALIPAQLWVRVG
jgi:hypothetical protein